MAQIATEFLCSRNSIRDALIKAKIPLRRRCESGHSSSIRFGTKVVKGRRVTARDEQKAVDTIIELRKDGLSFDRIADCLTRLKIPTKTRRNRWKGGSVRSIYVRACDLK